MANTMGKIIDAAGDAMSKAGKTAKRMDVPTGSLRKGSAKITPVQQSRMDRRRNKVYGQGEAKMPTPNTKTASTRDARRAKVDTQSVTAQKRTGSFKRGSMDDFKPGTLLESNKALNKTYNFLGDGVLGFVDTAKAFKANTGDLKGADRAWDSVKKAYTKSDGKADVARIAGSAIVAGTATRMVSGGGITRDANGRPDLMGVPFI